MAPLLKVLPGLGFVLCGFAVWSVIRNMESADVVRILDWIDAIVWLAGNQTTPNAGVPGHSTQRSSSDVTTATQSQGRTIHDRFLNALFEAKFLDRSWAPYLGMSSRARPESMSRVARIPGATLHERFMAVLRSIRWRRRLEAIARAFSADEWLRDAEPSRMAILLVPILVSVFLRRLLHRGSTRHRGALSAGVYGGVFGFRMADARKLCDVGQTSTRGEGEKERPTEGYSENLPAGEVVKPSQRTTLRRRPPDGPPSHTSAAAQPFDPADWKDSDDGALVATVIECPELTVAKLRHSRGDSSEDERQELPEIEDPARDDAHKGGSSGGACRCRKPPTLPSAALLLSSMLPKVDSSPATSAPRGMHVLPPSSDRK
ncbi:uncharacterized protein LOC144107497 isoform X1 [Amblyomma americanum]